MNITGTYWLLKNIPIWLVVLVLEFLCVDIFYIGREKFESLPYNIAWSSQYGDRALIACVLIGCLILSRRVVVPDLLASAVFQIACALGAIAAGLAFYIIAKPIQTMDIYHSLAVIPLLTYLLSTILPLIFYRGTGMEKFSTFLLTLIWITLVICDFKYGRMDQQAWLLKRGIIVPF